MADVADVAPSRSFLPEAEARQPQNARLLCFGAILLALRRDWTKKPDGIIGQQVVCRANTFAARRSSLTCFLPNNNTTQSPVIYTSETKTPLFVFFFLYFPSASPSFPSSSPPPSFSLLSFRRECSSPILTFKYRSPCLLTYPHTHSNSPLTQRSLASLASPLLYTMASVPPSDPKSKIDLPPNSGLGHW